MKIEGIFAVLAMTASACWAQHGHLNAGAAGTNQGDKLNFNNGMDFIAASGYVKTLDYSSSGKYSNYFNGNISLTAMQASDLIARGIPADEANELAGMLVFEDPDSPGNTSKNNINGNALTVLNGTIYLPKSNVDFSGTATVTSQCLMVAAATIRFVGDANMSTFCPAGMTEDTVVAKTTSKIKLVA